MINRLIVPTLVAIFLLIAGAPAEAKDVTTSVHRFITKYGGHTNARLYTPIIVSKAKKHRVPPLLVASLIYQESTFRQFVANGPCVGLMQVDRRYHFRVGERPFKAADNIEAGCRLLAYNYRRFGNWPQALTAYNFGPNHRVTRSIGTSGYARNILRRAGYGKRNHQRPSR